MKPFMAMALILMVSGVCRAATVDAEWSRWADLKEADQRMAADYQAALKDKGYTESDLPLSRLFQAFETAISSVQAQQDKDAGRLCDAIDAASVRGAIDLNKASELKARVAQFSAVRRYYDWGNFWRRLVLGGLGDDSSLPAADNARSVLGKRIDLAITDETLVAVEKENEFDPADYGIDSDFFHPKKIELNIDLTTPADNSQEADDSRTKADSAAMKKAADKADRTLSETTLNQ
jgi:hypothetical protein